MRKLIIALLMLTAMPAAWSRLNIARVDNNDPEKTVVTLVDTVPTTSLDIDGAVLTLGDTAQTRLQARGVRTSVTYDSAVVTLTFPRADSLAGAVLTLGINGEQTAIAF